MINFNYTYIDRRGDDFNSIPDYIETKAKKCMKITMCEETYHTL